MVLSVIPRQKINRIMFKFHRSFIENGRRRSSSFRFLYYFIKIVQLFFRKPLFCHYPFVAVFFENPQVSIFFNDKPCIGQKYAT